MKIGEPGVKIPSVPGLMRGLRARTLNDKYNWLLQQHRIKLVASGNALTKPEALLLASSELWLSLAGLQLSAWLVSVV